jgi:hypothetical protein
VQKCHDNEDGLVVLVAWHSGSNKSFYQLPLSHFTATMSMLKVLFEAAVGRGEGASGGVHEQQQNSPKDATIQPIISL